MNDARPVRIHVPEERLSTVCEKFGIRKLELFGGWTATASRWTS